MNRLCCFLTGGHIYSDLNMVATKQANPNWYTIQNKCCKCGKGRYTVEINVGKIIYDSYAERMKGGE